MNGVNYMYMRTLCKKDMESFGAVHIRRRQLGVVKNWSKLPTDSTKNCRHGEIWKNCQRRLWMVPFPCSMPNKFSL